jgi:autotransporter-associated beta strand protein
VTVNVNTANTVGSLVFNTSSTAYTLGASGGSLTLTNRDNLNQPSDTLVDVQAGSQRILANLILGADSANKINTFNVASGASLLVSVQGISQTGGAQNLTKTGDGIMTIDVPSSYTGTTRVHGGTLRTTGTGTISTGAALVDATGNINSTLNIGATQSVSSLNSSTDNGSGVATLTIASLGSLSTGGGTFKGGTNFGQNSLLIVSSGTQLINAVAIAANSPNPALPHVGAGVTATVALGATLELAGVNSALTDATTPLNRAAVKVDGTLKVDAGATQQVGGIDPDTETNGTVMLADQNVNGVASLTADHINLNSLVIGAGATFTLAPSAADGSPTVGGGLVLAGSLTPSSSFVAGGGMLGGAGSSGSSPAASLGGGTIGGSVSAVPEPSSVLLLLAGVGLMIWRKRRAR